MRPLGSVPQIKVEIEPELAACIETKARREYQNTLSRFLQKRRDERLEARLEIMRLFLETADFKQLREAYENYLVVGKRVKLILRPGKNRPKYEIKITPSETL